MIAPATIKFTNGLAAVRRDNVPLLDTAHYSVVISGFNDPLVSVPLEMLDGRAIKYTDSRVKMILRGGA